MSAAISAKANGATANAGFEAVEKACVDLLKTVRRVPELKLTDRLSASFESLAVDRSLVCFAGYFSVGKSSLINALIGRPLLAAAEEPESGVPCLVGYDKSLSLTVVMRSGERLVTEYSAAEFSRWSSLYLSGGQPNRNVEKVDMIALGVPEFPGGEDALWIDCPGIKSGIGENVAAKMLAGADAIFWVLRSSPLLSVTEAQAIAEQVRAAANVTIVVNVFFEQGDDGAKLWSDYLAIRKPIHQQRITDRLNEVGLAKAEHPPVLFTSVAAIDQSDQFNRADVLAKLQQYGDPTGGLVRSARLRRLGSELRWVLAEVSQAITAKRAEVSILRAKHGQERQNRMRISAGVSSILKSFVEGFRSYSDSLADHLAQPLDRNGRYEQLLNAELDTSLGRLREELSSLASRIGQDAGVKGVHVYASRELLAATAAVPIKVQPANNPVNIKSIALGAGGGAAGGTVIPGVGTFFGALIGAGVAAVNARSKASQLDLAETAETIRHAAEEVTDNYLRRHVALVKLIAKAVLGTETADLSVKARIDSLDVALGTLKELRRRAELAHSRAEAWRPN